MIGNKKLKHELEKVKNMSNLFLFYVNGPYGMENILEYCKEVFDKKNFLMCPKNSPESLRNLIRLSFDLNEPSVFIIDNVNNSLSLKGMNSLLKVTEEPNHGSIFIIFTNNTEIIPTIHSRAIEFIEEYFYSKYDLKEFCNKNKLIYTLIPYCNHLDDLMLLKNADNLDLLIKFVDHFKNSVKQFNCKEFSKSDEFFSTKKEDNKLDFKLFLKNLQFYYDYIKTGDLIFSKLHKITGNYLNFPNIYPSLNKKNWINSYFVEIEDVLNERC